VCGSCTLSKSADSKSGKNLFQVRLDMAEALKQETRRERLSMSDLLVKSNYARNRVVMLDGRHPLVFNDKGVAKLPSHLCELFEREMAAKPGRYTYVAVSPPQTTAPTVAPAAVEPVVLDVAAPVVAPVVEEPEHAMEPETEIEQPPKPVFAGKGKKKK
jgi:hypothetical protein